MNITKFPLYKLPDIPACLRRLADQLESGDEEAVRTVVILELPDGGVEYLAFGAEPFTRAHAIGLCFVAAGEI